MPKLTNEQKAVVLAMPNEEKDKLLLKLIAKNPDLLEKILFDANESSETLEERRARIKTEINNLATAYHYSPGWLMMDMRSINAMISHHVKITKDSYGEIRLTLDLLLSVFENQVDLLRFPSKKAETFSDYVVKRTEFILEKLKKMNPDYYIEFQKDLNKLLNYVHQYAPSELAKRNQIPFKWDY